MQDNPRIFLPFHTLQDCIRIDGGFAFPTHNSQVPPPPVLPKQTHALKSLPGYRRGCFFLFLGHEIQQRNIHHTGKGIDQGRDEESVPEFFFGGTVGHRDFETTTR